MIIFYITYIAAILLGIFCPNIIVLNGSETTEPIMMSTFCLLYVIIGGFWWLSKHKDHPIIGPIYHVIKLFFIVLFSTLMIGFAKKEIKEWWNKD
jgi:hypothetical protein